MVENAASSCETDVLADIQKLKKFKDDALSTPESRQHVQELMDENKDLIEFIEL